VFQRGAIVVSRTPEHWQNADTTMADRDVIQESEHGLTNLTTSQVRYQTAPHPEPYK